METIEIPHVGRPCSRIGLGTWAIGGWAWGGTDEQRSIRTILSAIDRGITLVDTAPVYGFGRSEEIVGRALADSGRRDEVVLATKVGLRWNDDEEIVRDSSPERLRREVDDSLRRLKTDVIDLYQVHWPDTAVPFAETAGTLERLREEGKIRAIGVSNFSPEQMAAFSESASLSASQPPYNVFERDAERDVLPWCAEHGVVTLTYGALCRGLLSGKITADREFGEDDLRSRDPKLQPGRREQYLEAVGRLDELARSRHDADVLRLALRWLLDSPGVGIALWGARRPEQLDPVAGVEGWHLDAGDRRDVDRIVEESVKDPVGPEFMAPPPSE